METTEDHLQGMHNNVGMGTNLTKINIYPKLYTYLAKSNLFIEPFYSHSQIELCKFIGTKENFYIRKRINS